MMFWAQKEILETKARYLLHQTLWTNPGDAKKLAIATALVEMERTVVTVGVTAARDTKTQWQFIRRSHRKYLNTCDNVFQLLLAPE